MARVLEPRPTLMRWFAEITRSYAQIFFAHSLWVGVFLVLATATEPATFAFALGAVVVASVVARWLRLDDELRGSGYFGYNALLVGAGIGHLYSGSWLAVPIAVVAAALSVALTCAAKSWFTRTLAMPALSLPFLAVFWLLTSAAPTLELSPPPAFFHQADAVSPLLAILADYARCLGSIFFLPTLHAGALVAVALLLHSRIASFLALGTFLLLSGINAALPSPFPPPLFSGLAANAMLLSIAVGGVWFVPSGWSVIWACAATLACTLLAAGLYRPLAALGLPILFLPFNLVAFICLLAARERTRDDKPKSIDFFPGSPEENLGYVLNRQVRFPLSYAIRFHLPFRGRWTCTQGLDGEHTHQGPWRHAFDFQIVDADGHEYCGSPDELTDYHCYKLPVLAAAAGLVVKIENDIADNPVGRMNLVQNWGNVVVLQHGLGIYSLVAHLARRSIKVKEGQQVVQGELLGLCGNSGRSPTPHIHFHLQGTPNLGANTLPISFCDVVLAVSIGERLDISRVPGQGDVCRNLEPSGELTGQLCPRPGETWRMDRNGTVEEVRVDLDLLGQTRLQSDRAASLVCTRTEHLLLLHDPVGNARSVLSLLRAALPRLPLEDNPSLVWKDYLPAHRIFGLFAGLASRLVPRPGLAMRYTLRKDAGNVVVKGSSLRNDRRGLPLLRTCIVFDALSGPVSIHVQHGKREEHAFRLPSESHRALSAKPRLPVPGEPPTRSRFLFDRHEGHPN